MFWSRSRLQLDFLLNVSEAIEDEHRRVLDNHLALLAEKLSSVVTKVHYVLKPKSEARPGFLAFAKKVNKAKYVVQKSTLDAMIDDLEKWQRLFDLPFFLLMRNKSPQIDKQLGKRKAAEKPTNSSTTEPRISKSPIVIAGGLRSVLSQDSTERQHVFLDSVPVETKDIPFSTAKLGRYQVGDAKWYIIDSILCQPGLEVGTQYRDVRQLATKLSKADASTFGLLNCRGFERIMHPVIDQHVSAFNLVFRMPDEVEPQNLQSLRRLLTSSDEHISLSRKFAIARELAKSVGYVHTFNFVHKNIRPESILCFEDTESSRNSTFLVGFDAFRSADGGTVLIGDVAWERNIYRHPSRQGTRPTEEYKMQHDMYSLGVCLLEIGLWESFVDYAQEVVTPRPTLGQSYMLFKSWLEKRDIFLGNNSRGRAYSHDLIASELKNYLVEMAREKLSRRMGEKYTHVVVSCLTCLDDDSEDFSSLGQMTDSNGILVAIRFTEQIIPLLEEITV